MPKLLLTLGLISFLLAPALWADSPTSISDANLEEGSSSPEPAMSRVDSSSNSDSELLIPRPFCTSTSQCPCPTLCVCLSNGYCLCMDECFTGGDPP